jgi:hypothetical protein
MTTTRQDRLEKRSGSVQSRGPIRTASGAHSSVDRARRHCVCHFMTRERLATDLKFRSPRSAGCCCGCTLALSSHVGKEGRSFRTSPLGYPGYQTSVVRGCQRQCIVELGHLRFQINRREVVAGCGSSVSSASKEHVLGHVLATIPSAGDRQS